MTERGNAGTAGEHDALHPVTTPHPTWTETVWFAWMVPERGLTGYVYPIFRPGLGVQTGGVLVFDPASELPWELPYYDFGRLAPFDADLDLCDADLPQGIGLRCIDPGQSYRITYSGDGLALDLRFDAIAPPLITQGSPPFLGAGHLDQPGHITGSMVLRGEAIAVNCYAMRDRSWGPRKFKRGRAVGYSYAIASEQTSLLTVTSGRRGDDRVVTGALVSNGIWSPVVAGERVVTRDQGGRVSTISLAATDERGRHVTATGEVVARQIFTPYPSMLTFDAMVRWQLDGVSCWGEDQDVWHPDDWRDRAQPSR